MNAIQITDPVEEMEGLLLEKYGSAPDVACHEFTPGQYWRTVSVPAGAVIVGHRHKQPCLNLMLKGKMLVWISGATHLVTAPHVFKSDGGSRKVAHILEDMVFTTVHPTNETDVTKLEEELFEKSPTWLAYQNQKELCQP